MQVAGRSNSFTTHPLLPVICLLTAKLETPMESNSDAALIHAPAGVSYYADFPWMYSLFDLIYDIIELNCIYFIQY